MAAGFIDDAAQVLVADAADPALYEDLPQFADEVVGFRSVFLVQLPGLLRQPSQSQYDTEDQHYSLHLISREVLVYQGDHSFFAGGDQRGFIAANFRSFLLKLP